ncbi:MAG: SIR2 family protein [Actinomycetota bacterium]|nr:SIR2 family protein [Actinomycetota bacterium]
MALQVDEPTGGGDAKPFEGAAFRELVESVKQGRCILFLGAGVHYPPPPNSGFTYPEAHRPPLAGSLAERLARKCDFTKICKGESDRNLQRVALCYERELTRKRLVEEIKLAVDDESKPSAAVRALAELPFPLVMTTNYDTLFERAVQRDGVDKRPQVGIYNPRRFEPTRDYSGVGDPTAERPFVFKMHGDVTAPDSLVVTDEDYITFILRMNDAEGLMHPVPQTFLYRLNKVPTLFVGYGLLDFNLRLLFRTMRWKLDPAARPESYAVDKSPDPLVSEEWKHDQGLRFIVEDVWNFVPRLYREVLGREMPS